MVLRHKFSAAAFLAVCALLCAARGFAFDRPAHGELPNLDKRRDAIGQAKPLPPARAAATEELKARGSGLRVERDGLLQTPKQVFAAEGFLTGPDGEGKAVSPQRARVLRVGDPHRPIKAFLNEHAGVFGHGAEVIEQLKPRRDFVARKNGLRTVVWEQRVDDIPVYQGVLVGHITARGELVSLSSQFIPDATQAATAGTPNRAALVGAPVVLPNRAVLLAAENVEEQLLPADVLPIDLMPQGRDQRQRFKAGTLPGEALAKLIWLPMDASSLRLCWEIEITRRAGGERFRVLLDAQTEEVYIRQRLTIYLTEASYRVFTGDSPSPLSPGWPAPNTNQPPVVPRSLVTLGALNTNASPIGWISDGENETRGNNVDAHHDWNADDLPDLPRPQGSPFRVFDPPLDFNLFAFDYSDAAVVNLFYWCNWMHDQLYDLGFDEASGNFQKDNFGRGGYGNDMILADTQDGSGVNNANFTPTADGVPGRIQMFLFTGPEPDRDGDFDTEVILHEYAHGLSTRLVGGGVGIDALQSAGMGEGWSDFYALALLSQPDDDLDASYAFGAYVSFQFGGLTENYYFGIRRFPYSTDLKKNPLTFKDIDPAQISFHSGVPANPANPINPLFANEVHASGEVWCSALWDARANLIRRHGFAAGNRLVLQLVTDGMKLSPPNPNFLQARDAIILADQVNNAGENYSELWAAFAKRGMGFSARSPDSSTTTGLVEAYDLPDALFIINPNNLVASGSMAGPFAPECRDYPLTNISSKPIAWSVRVRQPWLRVSATGGTLAAGGVTNVTVCLTTNAGALPLGSFTDTIVFSNLTTKVAQTRRANLRVLEFASMPFTEDFESGRLKAFWSVTGTGSRRAEVTKLNSPHTGDYHLTLDAVGGVNSRNEVTLGLDLGGYTNVVLRFWARNIGDEPDGPPPSPFIDEADFDGVAISDDGVHWYEVQSLRSLELGYTERVADLDAAIASHGLQYSPTFRIRFNQYDNFQIPFDGLGLDDISVTGTPARRLTVTTPEAADEGAGVLAGQGVVTVGAPVSVDLRITLSSSDATKVAVPDAVIIPAGGDRAVFDLNIPDNAQLDGTMNVTVAASAPGYFGHETGIAIADNETAALRVLLPLRAREGIGSLSKRGIVRAQPRPVRDVSVRLRSSDPGKVSVPSAVTIPGGQGSANFDLFVGDDGKISGPQTVTVTAHVENWTDASDTILILENDAPALAVVLPVALSEGNGTVGNAGNVRLSGVLSKNLRISLASSDSTELKVPASVEVPAGEIEARFDLTVVDDAQTDGRRRVTVVARAVGFAAGSGTMTIFDDETPPVAYAPNPPDESAGVPVSLALSWSPGIGEALSEGGYETGSFSGWVARESGFGAWVINDGKLDPDGPDGPTNAFAGTYCAMTTQFGAGEHLLYQDVFIPQEAQSATLSWVHCIRNHAAYFSVPNQQFRVEIRDTSDNVLAVAFETQPGDKLLQDWEQHSFDLSAHRGSTVRIAFHQQDNLGYFNVLIDQVGVRLGAPDAPTLFDVHFGATPAACAATRVGSTTNAFWALPQLALNTKYFWQIASRRGSTVTRGPVWEFTTRGVGAVHHFEWGTIALKQQVNQRFAVRVTARDDLNNAVKDFSGTVNVAGLPHSGSHSRVAITELDVAALDQAEFANVSTAPADLSGWQISVYDAVSWPGPLVTITLPTGSVCPPGAVFRLNEFGAAPGVFPNFYSGTNVAWNNAAVGNPIAVLLCDANGEVVDFVAAGNADPPAITVPLRLPRDAWSGPPASAALTNAAQTVQRIGREDHNDASDWVIAPGTFGTRNAGFSLPFDEHPTVPITPAVLTNFVTGVWTGFLTVKDATPRMTLRAEDERGHLGFANIFSVGAINDIGLLVVDSPDVVIVGGELTYSVAVSNSGPARATGVVLTNILPAEVNFVSAATFSGSCSNVGQVVICELGRLSEGDTARVTITARTVSFGRITNHVSIARTESDSYPGNNAAIAISTVTGPTVYSTNVVAFEGNSGTQAANFPVRLTAPCAFPVSVRYTTSNQTALAGIDYEATAGTLVFEPGVTNLTVAVPVIGDVIDEANETFFFFLSSPTNAVVAGVAARCRITDDELQPSIAVNDVTVTEGPDGLTNQAVFNVSVTGLSDLPLFVNFSSVDGTAVSPGDYASVFGTLVFPVGVSNLPVSVSIRGDRRFEPEETFALQLSESVNATLARPRGTAVILDDDAGELDHFEWSPVASPQFVDVPFFSAVTARDGLDRMATNFSGPIQISGITDRRQIIIGAGTNGWDQPMGTLFHDGRTQVIYLPEEVGGAGRINALALQVRTAPGQTMRDWTIRLKHGGQLSYGLPAWETNGWTIAYQKNESVAGAGWVTFLFDTAFFYNGADPLLVDFSFNNSTYSLNGVCHFTETPERRAIYFQTDSAFGDPLGWTGANSPPPLATNRIPNVRLSMEQPVSMTPAGAVQIIEGAWSGQMAARQPGTNIFLRASDGGGHIAESVEFDVDSSVDTNGNGLPDAWEARYFGAAGAMGSGAGADPDGDGLSNLQEFRAGTHPADATSAMRIVAVQRNGASVTVSFGSVAGRAYRLERTLSLSQPAWVTVADNLSGTGGVVHVSDAIGAVTENCFYRVRLAP